MKKMVTMCAAALAALHSDSGKELEVQAKKPARIQARLQKAISKVKPVVIMMIALSGTFQALAYYDTIGMPDMVNPTPYDVHQAEEASWKLGQASVELNDTSAACDAQLLSQQARIDADMMSRRIEEKRREEEYGQQWINISGNGTLPGIQTVDPFSSNVPLGDSGNTSMAKGVQTAPSQSQQNTVCLKLNVNDPYFIVWCYFKNQFTPYPGVSDRQGVCMCCGANLLGKQRMCSRCKTNPPKSYRNWKLVQESRAKVRAKAKEKLAQWNIDPEAYRELFRFVKPNKGYISGTKRK